MALRISQTYGQIGIDSWVLMDIRQTPPKAHIEQRPPELSIDETARYISLDPMLC